MLRLFGVERSHQAIWQRVNQLLTAYLTRLSRSRRGSLLTKLLSKLTASYVGYTTIDLESKLILDAELFEWHGTDPAAAFLHRFAEKHYLSDYPQKPWVSGVPTRWIRLVDAVFLVEGFGYQTVLAWLRLCGRRDYTDRNLIEKWFQTLKQCIGRFYHSCVGS